MRYSDFCVIIAFSCMQLKSDILILILVVNFTKYCIFCPLVKLFFYV